jgi:hypothetical protein
MKPSPSICTYLAIAGIIALGCFTHRAEAGTTPAPSDSVATKATNEALLTPEEARADRERSIAAALASKTSLAESFDTTTVTGAQVDESSIQRVIHVSAPAGNNYGNGNAAPGSEATSNAGATTERGSKENLAATLYEGFTLAYACLNQGTPTKIILASGTYREVSAPFVWGDNLTARSTLLIIEGEAPDKVTWTGADAFPLSAWKDEGDGFYSHDWSYQWGFTADSARYLQVALTPEQRAELKEYLTGGWLDYKD